MRVQAEALAGVLALIAVGSSTFSTAVRGGEIVVLRTASGRFVRAADDGSLRADQVHPTDAARFELDPLNAGRFALKALSGRYLVAVDPAGRVLRAASPRAAPGERETFQLVPGQGNQARMKVAGFREFIVFDPAAGGPRPAETIEVFHAGDVPAAIRAVLGVVIRSVIEEEVGDKEYDKTRTRKIEKWVEMPAPTIRDFGRKKRHRVLATEEQTQVKARLDGAAEFAIVEMPYLKGYTHSGTGLLMFVVTARVPFRGSVHYKMPNVVSAGTGYQATAKVFLVGEMRVEKSGETFAFSPAEVKLLRLELDLRDISNDLLNLGREQIEAIINRELRDNDARIRHEANKAIAKALSAQQFQHPLLKYLVLP